MAPKGEPGCRRHRSASEGEPPRGVDGIRRPRIACRRQGGVGLQQSEGTRPGHSLPVKSDTDGSLPTVFELAVCQSNGFKVTLLYIDEDAEDEENETRELEARWTPLLKARQTSVFITRPRRWPPCWDCTLAWLLRLPASSRLTRPGKPTVWSDYVILRAVPFHIPARGSRVAGILPKTTVAIP